MFNGRSVEKSFGGEMNAIVPKFLAAFAVGAVLMLVVSFSVYRRSYYYLDSSIKCNRDYLRLPQVV